MSAEQLVQLLTQGLFVVIFGIVAVKAVYQPRRTNLDIALLFGACTLIVAETWVVAALGIAQSHVLTAATGSLLMALPYLLLRLVDDFAGVPPALMRCAEVGLALAVLSLWVLLAFPVWLSLLCVAYFVGLTLYVARAFVGAAGQASGVTRRRMLAVATGSACLGLEILTAGIALVVPQYGAWWSVLINLFALAAGLCYFVGFAPPPWLRRAWQEPEVRAFLGRAASLPRLPTTREIIRELEHGAAGALGASAAALGVWDEAERALRYAVGEHASVTGDGKFFGGRVFTTQRALFSPDVARDDPAHAAVYQARGAGAMLGAPVTAGEKRLGVLVVYAPRAPVFAEDDLLLVKLLADQAAVILESRALIDEAARVRAREEVTHLKDDFLSAAAHDLKTPLTALVGQAQLLELRARRNPTAPADLAGIQRIVGETERLKRLVVELLDVARAERGQLVGHREELDLVAVVQEACLRHSTALHPCVLECDEPAAGVYDASRMMQLIDNLLENAVKYSPRGGEIHVAIGGDDGRVRLAVTDAGIGIPAGDLPHLFDRFHRGTNVDDRRFAGMGLGLYICRRIVEEHGGRIWAVSAGAEQGATFHVELPTAGGAMGQVRTGAGQDGALEGAISLPGVQAQ
jgi:signal transduction histidine kinase